MGIVPSRMCLILIVGSPAIVLAMCGKCCAVIFGLAGGCRARQWSLQTEDRGFDGLPLVGLRVWAAPRGGAVTGPLTGVDLRVHMSSGAQHVGPATVVGRQRPDRQSHGSQAANRRVPCAHTLPLAARSRVGFTRVPGPSRAGA